MTLKPWAWAGVLLFGAGAVTLVIAALVDLGKANEIAGVTGGVTGLAGLALALIAQFGGTGTATSERRVLASGDGSIAAGENIGTASTGGTTAPAPPSSPPPSSGTQASGDVTASGRGAIAAGGDIGSASTGM
ncbi:hypothetical protein [Streptomyces sp. NPDC086519]|uniref:hypothetical protein n=1 Tax=Streptomyces sp. NPDC086519 TaxID=3154863 RepID=UPI003444935B